MSQPVTQARQSLFDIANNTKMDSLEKETPNFNRTQTEKDDK